MISAKRAFGNLGEDAAAKYLRKKHYKIRERNFVSGKNEVDIIAENKEFLVFVEVKTRTYRKEHLARYGRAALAVTRDKQSHLLAAARHYIACFPTRKRIRMDVIEVYYSEGEPPRLLSLTHLEDAFRTS